MSALVALSLFVSTVATIAAELEHVEPSCLLQNKEAKEAKLRPQPPNPQGKGRIAKLSRSSQLILQNDSSVLRNYLVVFRDYSCATRIAQLAFRNYLVVLHKFLVVFPNFSCATSIRKLPFLTFHNHSYATTKYKINPRTCVMPRSRLGGVGSGGVW